MTARRDPIEHRLRRLQRTVRTGGQIQDANRYWRQVPEDLADDLAIELTKSEHRQMNELIRALASDRRYEHLFRIHFGKLDQREAEEAVWRFICLAHLQPATDHVRWFVQGYRKDLTVTRCFFPVWNFSMPRRLALGAVTLMPVDDPDVPSGKWFEFPPNTCNAIIGVECEGTERGAMVERARALAEHALSLLRVGLRAHSVVSDEQLRFRLGTTYVLPNGGAGWGHPADGASEVGLDEELRTMFLRQPLAGLSGSPTSDVERTALIALGWFDRARLTGDDLTRTLFNFFGLEALLGDREARLKGPLIAFRRALLSVAVLGRFRDPSVTFWLYEEVRSAAVHGGDPPKIDPAEHSQFNWHAWQALNEFLTFAEQRGLTSRLATIDALENLPEANDLIESLRARDRRWFDFTPGRVRGSAG